MADTKPAAEIAAPPKPDAKPPKPPNPALRAMGLPNMRLRLPSRNWMIFLAITGSFSAAVIYDKREKKRVQRKWCKMVEHIAKEPLDPRAMPRKLTVFLEGPPTDGLRIAQDHFKDYVKPILVASGLDWEFIQGRKEGDIRAELAEKIRKSRRPFDTEEEVDVIEESRRQTGIREFDGPRGDIVIGRHTWKEYIRGLHEGWLGPLTAPPQPEKPQEETPTSDSAANEGQKPEEKIETLPGITIVHSSEGQDESTPDADKPSEPEKPKKPTRPPPFIQTAEYPSAPTPSNLPTELDPSVPISFPHILGIINTPTRIYRFLTRRRLADTIGRETAAILLSTYRPYHNPPATSEFTQSFTSDSQSPSSAVSSSSAPEQLTALAEEEKDWHKSARKRVEGEDERVWLDDIVLDPRIATRMRRSELTPEDEERASRIVVSEEEIEGSIKGGLRSLFRYGKASLGFGAKKEAANTMGGEESD